MTDTGNIEWQDGDIDGVVVRPAVQHTDARGWLAEIFRSDELDPGLVPVMSYISVTKPGVARGPHAHEGQTDIFAFIGPGNLVLRLWDNRKQSPTFGRSGKLNVGEDNPVVVTVPPGIIHGYRNTGKTDAWVVNYPNCLFGGRNRQEPVDEVRYEDLPDSQFTI